VIWTDTLQLRPRTAETPYGPSWGAAVSWRARVEHTQKRVMTDTGEEVTASLLALLEPAASVRPGDRATWNGVDYQVVSVEPLRCWRRVHHLECYLTEAA